MSVFGKVREYVVRQLSLSNEKAWNTSLWALGGSMSVSGEVVTEYTALNYAAVWNAVTLISGTIGSLPLHLMQKKGDRKVVADRQRIYTVMHDQANDYMTAMEFRECMMAHVLMWGNGYAEIVRNRMNEVVALWPITPNRVRMDWKDGELIYLVRVDNQDIPMRRSQMLHLHGPGWNGFQGYSVIACARKSIGLSMALETFGAKYFGDGTHPGLVISHPGKLSQPAHENLRGSLATTYSGLGNAHKVMLLEEGMKPEKIGIPPDDSQFLESRQFQIPEVARWFNIPPHKLKDLTKSSFNNIEQEQQSFVTDTILPWLVRLEQNYNMQLLDPYDKSLSGYGSLYFKHSVEGILRGDAASRAAFYTAMFNIGAMSPNEIREKEDMDPYPGGDIRLVPMNMTTPANALKPPVVAKPLALPEKGNGEDKTEEDDKEEDAAEAEDA